MSSKIQSNERQLHVRRRLLGPALLSFMLVVAVSGCDSEARKLKSEIINASEKSMSGEVFLNVSDFTEGKVKKICAQGQYVVEESFFKLTGMDSPGFELVSESEFVLWVYLESRAPIQIKLNKEKVRSEGKLCTDSSVLNIKNKVITFN